MPRYRRSLEGFTELLEKDARKRVDALIAHFESNVNELTQRIKNLEGIEFAQAPAQALRRGVEDMVRDAKTATTECKTALDALLKPPKTRPSGAS